MMADISRGVTQSQTSFRYSFALMPARQREAIKTIYTFCRITDDIVDNDADASVKLENLCRWRRELHEAFAGTGKHPVLENLARVARQYRISPDLFQDLTRGVELDLLKTRYATFEELREYCYLVASTVGLMTLPIFSPRHPESRQYAIDLGIALQLSNILRDVAVDAAFGRIYIPQEDLRQFGCSESLILGRGSTPEFRALIEFELHRAEEYFNRADSCLHPDDRRPMVAALIMEQTYREMLQRIRRSGFDVFQSSVRVPQAQQLTIAVQCWLKYRVFST
jgi:phytoene synthase